MCLPGNLDRRLARRTLYSEDESGRQFHFQHIGFRSIRTKNTGVCRQCRLLLRNLGSAQKRNVSATPCGAAAGPGSARLHLPVVALQEVVPRGAVPQGVAETFRF